MHDTVFVWSKNLLPRLSWMHQFGQHVSCLPFNCSFKSRSSLVILKVCQQKKNLFATLSCGLDNQSTLSLALHSFLFWFVKEWWLATDPISICCHTLWPKKQKEKSNVRSLITGLPNKRCRIKSFFGVQPQTVHNKSFCGTFWGVQPK